MISLIEVINVGELTDRLTLDIVKPMVIKLAKDRIAQYNITPKELSLLEIIVKVGSGNASKLATELNQSRQAVSRSLLNLLEIKLVTVQQVGRDRHYHPVLEAEMAYSS